MSHTPIIPLENVPAPAEPLPPLQAGPPSVRSPSRAAGRRDGSTSRSIKKPLSALLRRVWLLSLRRVRRPLAWGVASVFVMMLAVVRFETSGEPRESTYYLLPPEKISGDEAQDKALEGLPEAIATRVDQMAKAMDHLFVEVPSLEQPTEGIQMSSVIRLRGRRGIAGLDGLPVDHFFFEWMPALDKDEQRQAKLRITAMAGPMPTAMRGTPVRVKATRGASQSDKISFALTVLLGDAVCEKKIDVDKANPKLSPAVAADAVASCILVHHIKRRLAAANEALRSSFTNWIGRFIGQDAKGTEYFRDVYESVISVGDINRQTDLFVGVERYSTFARTWEEQPSDARNALDEATERIHNAVRGDRADHRVPSYPLGEYLFAHVATTSEIGFAQRTGQGQTTGKKTDIEDHRARAFGTYPYECARWAHAMALRVRPDPSASPKAWEDVEAADLAACYRSRQDHAARGTALAPSDAKIRELKKLAAAQIASAYFEANQWDKAIRVRGPQVVEALRATTPRLAMAAEPAVDTASLEQAEILFEGGLDAMNIFGQAAQHHEVLRMTQRLATYAEQDMRALRDAINELVRVHNPGGKKGPIGAEIGMAQLGKLHRTMTDALTSCAASATTTDECKGLRDTMDAWLVASMDASHRFALLCLDRAIGTLSAMRARHCGLEQGLADCSDGLNDPRGGATGKNADARAEDAGGTSADASVAAIDAGAPPGDPGTVVVDGGATKTDGGAGATVKSAQDALAQPSDERQNRGEIKRVLVQVNDILAIAEVFRTEQMCRAPWLTSISLETLTEQTVDVRARSPLAPLLVSVLGRCALIAAATTTDTGKALLGQRRGVTMLDAWSWAPPSPDEAFKQELVLLEKKIEVGKGVRAWLHYPGVWSVMNAFTATNWEPNRGKLFEMLLKGRASIAKKDPWDGKAHREAVWAWAMRGVDGKDHAQDLRDAMATVGNELLRAAARREGLREENDETSCREILALVKCGDGTTTKPPVMPAECANVPEQRCPIDVEKTHYDSLPGQEPEDPAGSDEAIQAMIASAMAARTALANQLQNAIVQVLQPFLVEAMTAIMKQGSVVDDSLDAHTLPLLILRLSAAGREISGLRQVLMAASPAMAQKFAAALVTGQKGAEAPLLRAPDLIAALQGMTPFTDHGLPLSTEANAVASLDAAKLARCWPSPVNAGTPAGARAKRRWLRRFLSHVALNQHFYRRQDPIDRAAFGTLDLAMSYRAWCEWASDGTWPLVKDEDVLAFTWLWQEDAVGEEGITYVNGDDLPDYLVARGLLDTGRLDEAISNGRGLASGEGSLLRARAAVRANLGGLAVKYVFDAQSRLPRDGLALLEGELRKTEGDARLLLGTTVAPTHGWGHIVRAIRAYQEDSMSNSPLRKRRLAAALIEAYKPSEAARLLMQEEIHCWKDGWLLAIASRMRGVKRAEALRTLMDNPMRTVEDLPVLTGEDECGQPVFIGPVTKQFGRMLLNENR